LAVNSDGSLPVSGIFTVGELQPDQGLNPAYKFEYITSGTATGVTGSEIGSIIQFVSGGGSFVSVLTYSNNQLTNVGSWV